MSKHSLPYIRSAERQEDEEEQVTALDPIYQRKQSNESSRLKQVNEQVKSVKNNAYKQVYLQQSPINIQKNSKQKFPSISLTDDPIMRYMKNDESRNKR